MISLSCYITRLGNSSILTIEVCMTQVLPSSFHLHTVFPPPLVMPQLGAALLWLARGANCSLPSFSPARASCWVNGG